MTTFLRKGSVDVTFTPTSKSVNCSPSEGTFPGAFKNPVVFPLIEKSSPLGNEHKNSSPVPGLCFLFKLVSQVNCQELMTDIIGNKLDIPHQFGYKLGPSYEMALLSKNK